MTNYAAGSELIGAEIWTLAKTAIELSLQHPCQSSQISSQVTA